MDSGESRQNNISIVDYLEVLLINKAMIIKMTVAAFITAVLITLFMPKIYTSVTRILPPQNDQGIMSLMMGQMGGMASFAGDLLGKGSPADMYVSILKSEAVKDQIIDRFHLMDSYKQKYRVDTYNLLDQKVIIEAGRKDGIISISVDDKDPKKSADIANGYVDVLSKLLIEMNSSGAGLNKSFLEEQLSKARLDLIKAEDALKRFQSTNKALDIQGQTKVAVESIAQLRGQLAAQEVQLATLQRQFTDSSQEVKSVKSTIANISAQLARLEGSRGGGVIPSIGAVPELGQQYLRLMRDFKIQETLVELLTRQYEVNKISEAKNVSSLQVIQKARVPDKKSKPKRVKKVLAATAVTFIFSVFLAFLKNYVQTMPEDEKSRWQRLGFPFSRPSRSQQ